MRFLLNNVKCVHLPHVEFYEKRSTLSLNKANSPKSRALNDFENLNNCLILTES